jgi:hypothetical protein
MGGGSRRPGAEALRSFPWADRAASHVGMMQGQSPAPENYSPNLSVAYAQAVVHDLDVLDGDDTSTDLRKPPAKRINNSARVLSRRRALRMRTRLGTAHAQVPVGQPIGDPELAARCHCRTFHDQVTVRGLCWIPKR